MLQGCRLRLVGNHEPVFGDAGYPVSGNKLVKHFRDFYHIPPADWQAFPQADGTTVWEGAFLRTLLRKRAWGAFVIVSRVTWLGNDIAPRNMTNRPVDACWFDAEISQRAKTKITSYSYPVSWLAQLAQQLTYTYRFESGVHLTNWQWFSVVWTLLYRDLRHHMVKMLSSQQHILTMWWRKSWSIRVHIAENHCQFVFYHIQWTLIYLCALTQELLGCGKNLVVLRSTGRPTWLVSLDGWTSAVGGVPKEDCPVSPGLRHWTGISRETVA